MNIRNKKGKISTDTTGKRKKIKNKKLREYYEQFYVNKFDNQEEMDNFLETYSPPKLNQEEIDDLNRPVNRSEIKSVIKKEKLPTNKSPGPDGVSDEFYQANKE